MRQLSLGTLALEVPHAGEVHLGDLHDLGNATARAAPPGHAPDLGLPLHLAEAPGVLHHGAAPLAEPAAKAVDEVAALRRAALGRERRGRRRRERGAHGDKSKRGGELHGRH